MKTLQQRVSLGLSAALGTLLLLGGFLAFPALRSVLLDQFDYALLAKARALTAPTTAGGRGFSLRFTEYPPPEFQPGPQPEYFEVRTPDDGLMAKSPSLGSASLPLPDHRAGGPVFFNVTLPDQRPGRAVAIRLALGEGTTPNTGDPLAFSVVLARDTERLQRIVRRAMGGLLGGGLLLLLMVAWLARVATRAGLRPVATLAGQVTHIDSASLATRLSVAEAPPELTPIIEQLNSLLVRLHLAFDRERRFSANVAHELLTPVAELRALAENAVRWRDDKEATTQFAADVLDTARQMERVVNTLLALARSERGELPLKREAVDLIETLRRLHDQHSGRIAARKLSVEWSLPADATVHTDRAACESILQNFFENAVEYTPRGGRILCRLERDSASLTLTLANANPGLASADLLRLWEPFWRKDAARNDRAHAGLGLALVKSLAATLQFDVRAAMPEPDLFQITLRMPAN